MELFQDQNAGLTSTYRVIEELESYSVNPGEDDYDHRLLPQTEIVNALLDDIFGSVAEVFGESRLEIYTSGILSDFVNAFHRRVGEIERKLDTNQFQQREIQQNFDGSEVTTVKLERLVDEGKTFEEARNTFETIRDMAADRFEMIVGNVWMPHNRKSKVNHADRSAAVIDSRDFVKAQKINKTLVHIPNGTPVLFSGDQNVNDVDGICLMLDRLQEKTTDMVLVTTGGSKGADLIATKWASSKKVPVVAFGITGKGKKAPFDRNRQIFKELTPKYAVFLGERGVQANLRELSKQHEVRFADGFELIKSYKAQ